MFVLVICFVLVVDGIFDTLLGYFDHFAVHLGVLWNEVSSQWNDVVLTFRIWLGIRIKTFEYLLGLLAGAGWTQAHVGLKLLSALVNKMAYRFRN